MTKKVAFLFILLLLIGFVFAASEVVTKFTSGNSQENLTFSGNSNNTLYVDIPLGVYVTSFNITITGVSKNDI